MDKRRSILNISTSIVSRIILLIAALFVRRLLIRQIGNDVNGLNSLFTSIIGMLSVAELGVGRAIVFAMYKPIINGNRAQISGLYYLYRRLYKIVGSFIFTSGLIIMPMLPHFISDYDELSINVYPAFFLTLISVVISYLYGAKTSLIEAYKDNYITTGILTIASIIRYGLQAVTLLLWPSFNIFLTCRIISTLMIWLLTDHAVKQKHRDIISVYEDVSKETKDGIIRNVKAMFMHRIGTVLVKSTDSMIISSFIGVAVLGKNSNYNYIATTMTSIISLFFTPLTSVIGHLCATGNKSDISSCFSHFYTINYILGSVFFLGYYAVIDGVVTLLFGEELEVSRSIAFIITLNQFTQYMRNSALLFRNASGTFYYDRWKPMAEGAANLILSLLFVQIFPDELKVVGVIVATIITTLLICDIVEPYVIFKHVLSQSSVTFCLRNYAYIGLFTICLVAITFITDANPIKDNIVSVIFINGLTAVGISLASLTLIAVLDKKFRKEIRIIIQKSTNIYP